MKTAILAATFVALLVALGFRWNCDLNLDSVEALAARVLGGTNRTDSGAAQQQSTPSVVHMVHECNDPPDTGSWWPDGCTNEALWLVPWIDARPQRSSWVMVDVGANKGYLIARWLGLLTQNERFTPESLGVYLYRNHGKEAMTSGVLNGLCGACCDCLDKNVLTSNVAGNVKIVAIEPSLSNVELLRRFFMNRDDVQVMHAAVSNVSGVAYFPITAVGMEQGKLSSAGGDGMIQVQVKRLDEVLKDEYIHVLVTDVEGFDIHVQEGALRLLRERRVGVYQFEMHAEISYRPVFERLMDFGYACYFYSRRRSRKAKFVPMFIRVTGCWSERFEPMVGFINAICHDASDANLTNIFSAISRRFHKGYFSNCPSRKAQITGIDAFLKGHNIALD